MFDVGTYTVRCTVNSNNCYRFYLYSATNDLQHGVIFGLYILIFKCHQLNRSAKAVNPTRVFRKFYRTDNVNGPWPTLRFGSPFVDF